MDEYKYKEIGNRIKEERKKKRKSQEEFLSNIKEKGKPCIGRNTLSKIENGDQGSLNAISMEQLTSICEELECSISYILGEYSYRNYDNKFISEQTGLTENSLNKILHQKNDFLNAFISSRYFYDIDYSFDQMQHNIEKINQCIENLSLLEQQCKTYSKDSHKYQQVNKKYFDIVSSSENLESQIHYSIYKMGIDFGKVIETVKENTIKKIPNGD